MTGPILAPVLIVSGTGTEVGKTVVTAAVAALAASRGRRVAVVKLAQTGEPPGPAGAGGHDPRARHPQPHRPHLEALSTRRLLAAGVVIGAWPAEPGLAERANLTDLAVIAGQPLAGVLPADAARLSQAGFLAAARAGLSPGFGGTFQDQTNCHPQ